jgi:hypothetical protein
MPGVWCLYGSHCFNGLKNLTDACDVESCPHPLHWQVPRFTTMLRSFAASGSASDDSIAAQHLQRSALLQRKRAQATSAQVTGMHVPSGTFTMCCMLSH